jgi:acetyl esterase/lipase
VTFVGRLFAALLFSILFSSGVTVMEEKPLMSAADVVALPRPVADFRLFYGEDPWQFGELRVPEGEGPFPVVVVIHGGCWLAEYDLGYVSAFADALTETGLATWSIEYRRVGNAGGGWPGTFRDVAEAVDHLREIACDHGLDLSRVAVIGHSAGGHLALWLGARGSLDAEDPFRGHDPVVVNGVVALAAISDLAAYAAPDGCGSAVPGLLGGAPSDVPDRLRRASPIEMLPFSVKLTLVTGEFDPIVPASQAEVFSEAAREKGDLVETIEIAGVGHFELIDPSHPVFGVIREAVRKAVEP